MATRMTIPSIWWTDMRQKGSWICLQTDVLAQDQLLRVLVLCAR